MKDIIPMAHYNRRVLHGGGGARGPSEQGRTDADENELLAKSPPDKRRSTFGMIPHYHYTQKKNAIYQTKTNRPRWVLHMQAQMWRFLMSIGMLLHRLAPPRPPKPNFYRSIPTKLSGKPGDIILYFYVPADYLTQKHLWEDFEEEDEPQNQTRNKIRQSIDVIGDNLRRRSRIMRRWGGYPVVINFHGGGFTLGSPQDDARWCGTVVTECNAVVVSVDYRLAPEFPFPTAVEDGVDAVLYIHKHAEELGIDPEKICLSGFSSGANMAFTVPLRLYDQQTGFARDSSQDDLLHRDGSSAAKQRADQAHNRLDSSWSDVPASSWSNPPGSSWSNHPGSSWSNAPVSSWSNAPVSSWSNAPDPSWSTDHGSASTTHLTQVPSEDTNPTTTERNGPPSTFSSSSPVSPKQPSTFHERTMYEDNIPEVRIKCIVPWYPSLDYTRTREERRATCVRADQELPALFTDLFDDSYLHPPKDVSLDSPYLSPGVAPTSLLRNALPKDIIMHTCEYDMLLDEGKAFYERLTSDEIDKDVIYTMVEGVPHGWDKAPNPWKPTPGVKEHYLKACKEIRRILGDKSRLSTNFERGTEDQPRKSIVR